MKNLFTKVLIFLILFASSINCSAAPKKVTHAPWSLIIYRPDNNESINELRCWVKIVDAETGEDVTYTKAKANYEYVADRKKAGVLDTTSISSMFKYTGEAPAYNYKKTYFLSGGMAMHLLLQKGKYKISVYTPKDHAAYFPVETKEDWLSNEFEYDTENPLKVIFVSPTANDNGFYNGGWYIDYKAPQFYKVTKPKIE